MPYRPFALNVYEEPEMSKEGESIKTIARAETNRCF